ncbi:MAG: TSUP family transporter [Alphaproteobacteria bacterium]|nr:TSUP family transporter [Alphaproteobacteria bacterium]
MSAIPSEAWLVGGAFVAAIASGLAGFAFALVASGTFLHFRAPIDATPLVLAASLIAQCFSILAIRDAIDWKRLAPFLVGGLVGIPLGVALLHGVSPGPLKQGIGAFLVAYALFMLLRGQPQPISAGGRPLDAAIGFVGGAMGGLGGLSGAVPTIWTGLRGWTKNEQRAVYQPYIFAMQAAALAWLWLDGGIGPTAIADFAWCLPAVALGVWLGLKLYARVDDVQFRRIVLALLLASGVVLVV